MFDEGNRANNESRLPCAQPQRHSEDTCEDYSSTPQFALTSYLG